MEAMHASKLEAFYRNQFQSYSSSPLKACASNRIDNERTYILINQANLWKRREKIKRGNLGNLLTLGITQKGSLREKLDQKWKSNGYWQALTGSNQGLIHLSSTTFFLLGRDEVGKASLMF